MFKKHIAFFFIGIALFGSLVESAILPRKLGEFDLQFAAYLQIFEEKPGGEQYDPDKLTLFISTFNPRSFFQPDPKFYIKGPGNYLKNVTALAEAVRELDRTAFWPNGPDFVGAEVFGYEAVAWPSGFLVPGKTHGQLQIYNLKNLATEPVNIASKDSVDWYYHRSIWLDVNNDGHVDAVTARFKTPTPENPTRGEFIWLENPGGPLRPGWNQHLLVQDGPDVHFRHVSIPNAITGQITDCFLAAEFWNEELNLYCVDGVKTTWTSEILEISVDPNVGRSFDCLTGDLNMDGNVDLVVTAYNAAAEEGFVFAYEVPDNFPDGSFRKHTIASGFRVNAAVPGESMSPGSVQLFHRHVSEAGSKPSVMLSGDDDGCHYILTPMSEDHNDWTYSKNLLVNTTMGTSGTFAVEDMDGDGWTDIIAAGYSSNTLYVYTFAPEFEAIENKYAYA